MFINARDSMSASQEKLQKEIRDALRKSESRSIARLSDTAQRSPQINPGLRSPVKSVHPDMQGVMDSLSNQSDVGMRTLDFFDDGSDHGSQHTTMQPMDIAVGRNTSDSSAKRRQSASSSQVLAEQCEARRSSVPLDYHKRDTLRSTNVTGGEEHASSSATMSTGRSHQVETASRTLPDEQALDMPQFPAEIAGWNDRYSAHALAHQITLQALMRDESGFDHGLASLPKTVRKPTLPSHLWPFDPRSPRDMISFNGTGTTKHAHVLPPPIDTDAATRKFPENPARTPYPTAAGDILQKKFGRSPGVTFDSPSIPSESILTLSIRRCNANSRPRVTTVTIPSPISGGQRRSQQPDTFDDAALFTALGARYSTLVSPLVRYFSARSLSRIAVSGRACKAADAGYGWIHSPRSPRFVAWKGLSDSFSEDKILHHYRHPALGKSRYAFVQWVHRLASAPEGSPQIGADEEEGAELVRRKEQPEGLEFVVSWSWKRILGVLLIILMLALAAVLLWIFLGRTTVLEEDQTAQNGGLKNAGDRVGTGILLGIGVLLGGLTGMAGWVGLSWLVM